MKNGVLSNFTRSHISSDRVRSGYEIMSRSSSETQGRLAGATGNKSGKEMKRRWFTSKAFPTITDCLPFLYNI